MIGYKWQKFVFIVFVFIGMDIIEFFFGNYNLIVEVCDCIKGFFSSKIVFFQCSNLFLEEAFIEMVDFDVKEEFVQLLDVEELEYSFCVLILKML